MRSSKLYARGLQKCLANLWKSSNTNAYDFTVVAEDSEFNCHRLLLSACSGYFRETVTSNTQEHLQNRLVLTAVTASTFQIIINALYTGKRGLNNDNVLDVWSAAEMLKINYIKEGCQRFVIKNITVDNCCRILDQATLFTAQNVIDHSLEFIVRRFKYIRQQDLLELPIDNFYKVIAHDSLATDNEEFVVDTVLGWTKHKPRSAVGDDDRSVDQPGGDPSTHNSYGIGDQENSHDMQMDLSHDLTSNQRNTVSQSIATSNRADTRKRGPVEQNNANTDVANKDYRKQHLIQLMSACRLFTAKPSYLSNIMHTNHARLLLDTGACTLVREAVLYTANASRRHDAWPEPAVYRSSSSHKHAMIYVSENGLMAYDLNTSIITEYAPLPREYEPKTCVIAAFDNILYLLCKRSHGIHEFCMLSRKKSWVNVNSLFSAGLITLLPHGDYIYCNNICVGDEENCRLVHRVHHFYSLHGDDRNWNKCGTLKGCGDCIIRFKEYILVFWSKNNIITSECYNTDTKQTHTCTTGMSGASKDMVSFRIGDDVYILQTNGTLWKVSGKTPVDFERVSKLWAAENNIKGCILYKQTLFIFNSPNQFTTLLTSLPGIFSAIQIIAIDTHTACLPIIISACLPIIMSAV